MGRLTDKRTFYPNARRTGIKTRILGHDRDAGVPRPRAPTRAPGGVYRTGLSGARVSLDDLMVTGPERPAMGGHHMMPRHKHKVPATAWGAGSRPGTLSPESTPPGGVLAAWKRIGLVGTIAHVLNDPMLRNGHALIFSSGVTQIIGVLYWVVAARYYPAAVVGRNSVALSLTLFLAGGAELNLMSTLVRFLPPSGTRSARFILIAYAASASVAALVGFGFLFLIPSVEPQLGVLRASPVIMLWFVVSVVTGAIFVLQDSALTGVRATPFVPVENATFSLLKLGLMFPLVALLPAAGIYVSWTAAIAICIIPTNAYLFFRAIPRHVRRDAAGGGPPRFKDIRSYLIPDSLAGYFLLASTYLLPTLVIDRLGPAAAGHYALAWIIGYALYSVSLNMGSSLVVETAADQLVLRERCLRSITHLAKLLGPAVLLVIEIGRAW